MTQRESSRIQPEAFMNNINVALFQYMNFTNAKSVEDDVKHLDSFKFGNVVDTQFFMGPVKCYTKFKIKPTDVAYTDEEHTFRVACLREEVGELKDAIAASDTEETIDALVDLLIFAIGTSYRHNSLYQSLHYYNAHDKLNAINIVRNAHEYNMTLLSATQLQLEYYINEFQMMDHRHTRKYNDQINKIISCVITFLLSEYDNDLILKYYDRVINANLSKEIGSLPKRGSFSIDLIKPEGWSAPNFIGLLNK